MAGQNKTPKQTPPPSSISGKWLLQKGIAALVLYLGASPLFLLPGVFILPGHEALLYGLPFLAVCLALMAGLFSGRRRKYLFAVALFLQAALCAIVLFPIGIPSLFYFLPCLALMLMFMPALNRPAGMEWPGNLLGYAVALHLAGQAVKGQEIFHSAGQGLTLFFSVYILLCLFLINRYALAGGTAEECSPPKKLLTKNRRLLSVFGLLAVIAACIDALRTAAESAFAWLRNAFFMVLLFLASLFPQLPTASDRGAGGDLDLTGLAGEVNEPSLLSVILEKIMVVLGLLIAALLLGYVLYHLARLLKRVVVRLLARIRDYSKALGEGYVDQTKSLLDLNEIASAAREKWIAVRKRLIRPPSLNSLSPREQVRRVYALLLARSHAADPTLTAREALSKGCLQVPAQAAEKTASLYEKARYSSLPVSAEEAQAMRDTLEKP